MGRNKRQINGGQAGKETTGKAMEKMHGNERQASDRRKGMGMNDRQDNGGKAWEGTTGKGRNDNIETEQTHQKGQQARKGKGIQERQGKKQ